MRKKRKLWFHYFSTENLNSVFWFFMPLSPGWVRGVGKVYILMGRGFAFWGRREYTSENLFLPSGLGNVNNLSSKCWMNSAGYICIRSNSLYVSEFSRITEREPLRPNAFCALFSHTHSPHSYRHTHSQRG